MRAEPHPRQNERLAVLKRLEVLDTPREKQFDEVVELIAKLCDVPIAIVNLIDEHRQWFKAEVGLGVRQTPLETSICSHVILQGGLTVICDTLGDVRLSDNPLCISDPNIRFYAGMCLEADDGLPIGTLCILDTKPRDLTLDQRHILQVMGRQVMRQIELASALKHAQLLRQEVDHRIKNSLAILQSLLNLQSRNASSAEVAEALMGVRGRIEAIALIHDQLHKTAHICHVNLAEFINSLREALTGSIGNQAIITASVPSLEIGTSEATNIGIVVNELVTNAVKHGAVPGQKARVHIAIDQRLEGLGVVVKDEGLGLPADFEPRSSRGLGMRISMAIAKQLGSELKWTSSGKGTQFEFTAPYRSP
jgi:two-component sensor histidine kinase